VRVHQTHAVDELEPHPPALTAIWQTAPLTRPPRSGRWYHKSPHRRDSRTRGASPFITSLRAATIARAWGLLNRMGSQQNGTATAMETAVLIS